MTMLWLRIVKSDNNHDPVTAIFNAPEMTRVHAVVIVGGALQRGGLERDFRAPMRVM